MRPVFTAVAFFAVSSVVAVPTLVSREVVSDCPEISRLPIPSWAYNRQWEKGTYFYDGFASHIIPMNAPINRCRYGVLDAANNVIIVAETTEDRSRLTKTEINVLTKLGLHPDELYSQLQGEPVYRQFIYTSPVHGVHPTETHEWHEAVSRSGQMRKDPDYNSQKCASFISDLLLDIAVARTTYYEKFGVEHGPVSLNDVLAPIDYNSKARFVDHKPHVQLINWQGSSMPSSRRSSAYYDGLNDLMTQYDAAGICA